MNDTYRIEALSSREEDTKKVGKGDKRKKDIIHSRIVIESVSFRTIVSVNLGHTNYNNHHQ